MTPTQEAIEMNNDTTRPQPRQCRHPWLGLDAWLGPGAATAPYGPWGHAGVPQTDSPGHRGDDLRVSDAERQATAEQLKAHFAAGRLDLDEYEERLQQALVARTRRHLDDLVRDLPPTTAATVRPPQSRLFFVPVLFAVTFLALFSVAFGALHSFFFPWWIIPVAFYLLSRYWRRGWRPV
ncbi:MAG TPA: DUF1707 domain-containing protein [Acidimicrobiales bacterium]|nr:DUF1707 domain-containing protein [Acidimicrobiales bacterium]